jgi:hypothetical protein
MQATAQTITDIVTALVGLLAAEAFLIGLLVQRMDRILDEGLRSVRQADQELRYIPAQVDIGDALEHAQSVRDAITLELRRSPTRSANAILAMLTVGLGLLAEHIWFGNWDVPSWVAPTHPSQWQQAPSSAGALAVVAFLLWVFAEWRTRRVHHDFDAGYRDSGLPTVLDAFHNVFFHAWAGEYALPQRLADRCLASLHAVVEAYPSWHWGYGLSGLFWFAVADDPRLRAALGDISPRLALERATRDYRRAIARAPTNGFVRMRRADAFLKLANEMDGHGRLQVVNAALNDLSIAKREQISALEACVLEVEALETKVQVVSELTPADLQRRRSLQSRIARALEDGLGLDEDDDDLVVTWARYTFDADPPATEDVLRTVGHRLVDTVELFARRVRTASGDDDVLYLGERLTQLVASLGRLRDLLPLATFDQIARGTLGPLLDHDMPIRLRHLRSCRKAGSEETPHVLAETLLAAALEDQGRRIAAAWTLVECPVRLSSERPFGRISAFTRWAGLVFELKILLARPIYWLVIHSRPGVRRHLV